MAGELSDAEVFGAAPPKGQQRPLTDDEVFNQQPQAASTPPPSPRASGSSTLDFVTRPGTPLGELVNYGGRVASNFSAGAAQEMQGLNDIADKGQFSTGIPRILLGGVGAAFSPVTAAIQPAIEPVLRPVVNAIDENISKPIERSTGYPSDITTPAILQVGTLGIAKALRSGPKTAPEPRVPPPSNPQLKASAQAAYKAADDAGIVIKPETVQGMSNTIKSELADNGFHPELQPGTATILRELDRVAQGGNITLKGMDTLRKIASQASNVTNRSDMKFTGKIVKHIDDTLGRLTSSDVLMGNAEVGVAALARARLLWNKLSKSEMIDTAIEKATRQAARTGSGGNIENSLRQQFSSILESNSKRRGFTPKEITLMERVVRGNGGLHETLRLVGKLSPRGNGLMAALFGGAGIGTMNPAFLLPPALGFGAKLGSEALTRSNVAKLSETVRGGAVPTARPPSYFGRSPSGTQPTLPQRR